MVSTIAVLCSNNMEAEFVGAAEHDEHCHWNHYAAVEATTTHFGSKEFWACCTHAGEHSLAAPTNGEITDMGQFSGAAFEALTDADDRFIPALTKTVTKINSPIIADGVTLDADKFASPTTALQMSAVATGVDAIGTTFTLDHVFSESEILTIDFRVFSEKGYTPADSSLNYTHDYCWYEAGHPSQAGSLYSSDKLNPYMDLKEVTITATSVSDPSIWVKCMVRGGAAGRADLSTARVLHSSDEPVGLGWTDDGVGKQILYGYGAQCDDGWPYVSWMDCNGTRYTELTGAFSNNVVTGNSECSKITLYPDSYTFMGWAGYNRAVRDCTGNWNMNDDGAYGYKNLAAGAFAAGFKLSFTFSDVTANDVIAESLDGVHSYNNPAGGYDGARYTSLEAQYATFDTPYERHANMVLYGIKVGDSQLDLNNLVIE